MATWHHAATLSEEDARALCAHVTEALHGRHVHPTRIGVHLDREGFWFAAEINGREGTARTGQGSFTYAQVAKELDQATRDLHFHDLIV